jgi:flagellar biosynthesis anti-sigma factor FlgM
MKIDGNQLGGVQKPGFQEAQQAENAKRAARLGYRDSAERTSESGLDSPPDQVELSGLGRELSRLANADTGRQARIDELSTQYAEGKLHVDAGKVAAKIVDDAFLQTD